jgi:hypothetical protein
MVLALAGLLVMTTTLPPLDSPGWMIKWSVDGDSFSRTGTFSEWHPWLAYDHGEWSRVQTSSNNLGFCAYSPYIPPGADPGEDGGGSSMTRGKMQAKFQWHAGTPAAPAPTKLYVRLSASTASQYHSAGNGSGAIGNPLTDVQTEVDEPPVFLSAQKSRVYMLTADSGADDPADLGLFLTNNLFFLASASAVAPLTESFSTCSMTATTLPSPYITTTHDNSDNFHMGTDGAPERNVRDADGNKVIDVAASLDAYNPYAVRGSMDLHAQQSLYGLPGYLWHNTGEGMGASDTADLTLTLEATLQGAPPALNKTSTVQVEIYDLQDEENAKANASYGVKWHFPYENWALPPQLFGDIYRAATLYSWTPNNLPSVGGGTIAFQFGYMPAYMYKLTNVLSYVFDVGANTDCWWLDMLLAAASLGCEGFITLNSDNGSVSFNGCWGVEGSEYFPSYDATKKDLYLMEPLARMRYREVLWSGEAYNEHGFAGRETIRILDSAFPAHRGKFMLQSGIPVIPGPGGPVSD